VGKYRYIGTRADQLANGRPVGPGDFVELTDEDLREPHNEMLAADGKLIGVEDDTEHQQTLAERRVSRRAKADDAETNDEGEES
jgi:hypothetical protein